jgi:integrase/recombinase XerD
MLTEIYPRDHARFSSLPLLGPYTHDFVVWLHTQGYPLTPIQRRVRALPRVDALLRRRGANRVGDITALDLLRLGPKHAEDDVSLAAAVRSLASWLEGEGRLAHTPETPRETLIKDYKTYLQSVRGLAESTESSHAATAAELLAFIRFDGNRACLHALGTRDIEAFVRSAGSRLSRATLQHTVARLRSFLRFLATRKLVDSGLNERIDTPRLYRREQLPRALPWDTVRAFLAAIDRSTPMGKRDYAMMLLVATYGLRTSEVSALRLEHIKWRAGQLRVLRPKTQTALLLPLTDEIGAALIDYIRHGRPTLPFRELFLRVRTPPGPLLRTGVTDAFQTWRCRSGLPIPYQGPHCLRHSLAVHLLRQGAPLKAIGDLLGHRTAESTCVYLRLHVEDLRDTALNLPQEARS